MQTNSKPATTRASASPLKARYIPPRGISCGYVELIDGDQVTRRVVVADKRDARLVAKANQAVAQF